VTSRPPRCLLGMVGVDMHSKGIRSLSVLLRDRGIEVVYGGEHNSPQSIVRIAQDEDVDVVGLSFSTSTYLHHIAAVLDAMRAAGIEDIPLIVGGLIHREDEPKLAEMGVAAVFGPGSSTTAIVDFLLRARDAAHATY
jgi:methylmalonyl-CoA mutase, C-terminal domain